MGTKNSVMNQLIAANATIHCLLTRTKQEPNHLSRIMPDGRSISLFETEFLVFYCLYGPHQTPISSLICVLFLFFSLLQTEKYIN